MALAALMRASRRDAGDAIGARVRETALCRASTIRGGVAIDDDAYAALSAFVVMEWDFDDARKASPTRARCVSLATGTKCVGFNTRAPDGGGVADAHAEVLARRAFARWLHVEYAAFADGKTSVFERDDGLGDVHGGCALKVPVESMVRLRRGVEVHVYCSQSPCGDASVFELRATNAGDFDFGDIRGGRTTSTSGIERNKRAKTTGLAGGGAGTTGAKIMSVETRAGGGGGADPERDRATKELGAIRWKPGRGDPSFCLSCSDKLCRWSMFGLQGRLMRLVARDPITPSSVCVSTPRVREEDEDEAKRVVESALKRAIVDRVECGESGDANGIDAEIEDASLMCVAVAPADRTNLSSYEAVANGAAVAAPVSTVYIAPPTWAMDVEEDANELSRVERILGACGYLQGSGKKSRASGAGSSALSARKMCESFDACVLSRLPSSVRDALRLKTYAEVKSACAPRRALSRAPSKRASNPIAERLAEPIPGKDKDSIESFVPFT